MNEERRAPERMFPVLWQGSREVHRQLAESGCPREVPWAFIDAHRDACLRYHSQSPEQLAERGGLAPAEILVVIADKSFTNDERRAMWRMPTEEAVCQLKDAIAQWKEILMSEEKKAPECVTLAVSTYIAGPYDAASHESLGEKFDPVEYVRADIHEAVKAERDRAVAVLDALLVEVNYVSKGPSHRAAMDFRRCSRCGLAPCGRSGSCSCRPE